MATSISAQQLAQQIERLVEEFIAAGREAAATAVDRAFAPSKTRKPPAPKSASRQVGPRRCAREIESLSERLYDAICAKPGESMTVLAPIVGSTPRALLVPVQRLKTAGQIRTVGQRRFARYFPMTKNASKPG
jgi:hypothetical protein